jgi:WS/DGAT/MGAT family acyltransferase
VPATAFRLATTVWRLGRQGDNGTPTAKPFTAPRTLFNATITARRSVAFTDVTLADIKKVKDAFGVTVNDVVTAVVGGALRHYLEDRGELPDRSLLAAAPVSVHDQTAERGGMTKISVMFSTLATDEKDPVERLRAIASANTRAKEIHRMVGADTLMRWAEHFWLNAFALGARLYSSLHVADHHRVVHNLILSNVPGPPVPLYMAGARLVGLYPLGPITDGAGLNVTVLSQEDRVGFGIITCPDLVPRVWDLADAVPGALAELVEAATRMGRPAKRSVPAHSRRGTGG